MIVNKPVEHKSQPRVPSVIYIHCNLRNAVLDRSHGFHPKRSYHTALSQIKDTFTGVRWMVEGDIKACFDCFDHHVLIDSNFALFFGTQNGFSYA